MLLSVACPFPLIDGSEYSVPGSAFEASSTIRTGSHNASEARLSGATWCSRIAIRDRQPWIKVTFDQAFFIHKIGVAGLKTINISLVINFNIQYRPINSSHLISIMEANDSALHKVVD